MPASWRFHPRSGDALAHRPADAAVERAERWGRQMAEERARLRDAVAAAGDPLVSALLDGLLACHAAGDVPALRDQVVRASPELVAQDVDSSLLNRKLTQLGVTLERGGCPVRLAFVVRSSAYRSRGGADALSRRAPIYYLLSAGPSVSVEAEGPAMVPPEPIPAPLSAPLSVPPPSPPPRPFPRIGLLAAGVASVLVLAGALAWPWPMPRTNELRLVGVPHEPPTFVEGLDAEGDRVWAARIGGRSDGDVARWPRATEAPAEFVAVGTPARKPDDPGELRAYDVREPGEPALVLDHRMVEEAFRDTPEPIRGGHPTGYGYPEVELAEVQPGEVHLVAIARDHLMAPTWLIELRATDGREVGEVYHPGHLDVLTLTEGPSGSLAFAAGLNNRLCLRDERASMTCPATPVVIELPLPMTSGQLPPGCGEDLPMAAGRMWAASDPGLRFDFVEPIEDGSGAIYVHADDRATGCWAIWRLVPGDEPVRTDAAPACQVAPELARVGPGVAAEVCARLSG